MSKIFFSGRIPLKKLTEKNEKKIKRVLPFEFISWKNRKIIFLCEGKESNLECHLLNLRNLFERL